MQKIYRIKTSPCARQENMIIGNQYRITVLTEGLVRLEYNADGEFEDRATQMVLYRDFPEVDYRVIHTENGIEINTSRLHLVYDEKEFSSGGLRACLKIKNCTKHVFLSPFHDRIKKKGAFICQDVMN